MTAAGDVAQRSNSAGPTPTPIRANKPIKTGDRRLAFMLIAPTIILLILIVGYPIVKGVISSFETDPGLDPATGFFNKGGAWNGLTNYKHWLLQRCGTTSCPPGNLGDQFWSSIYTTLLFAVATVVLETIIGMIFALIMNRAFPGRSIVRAAILIPWAIPTAVTSKLWGVVFDPSGILNKVLGTHFLWTSQVGPARAAIIIADTWKTSPFIALLILAGLQGIIGRNVRGGQGRRRDGLAAILEDHFPLGQAGLGRRRDLPVTGRAAHVRPAADPDRRRQRHHHHFHPGGPAAAQRHQLRFCAVHHRVHLHLRYRAAAGAACSTPTSPGRSRKPRSPRRS